MVKLSFINFILESHPSIDPETNERYRSNKQAEEVNRIVSNSSVPRSRIWVTYSDIPKLGIKPEVRFSKNTPVGVFAYPVDYYLYKNGDMPYANDRKHLIIFEVKGNLLEVGIDSKNDEHNSNNYISYENWKLPIINALRKLYEYIENNDELKKIVLMEDLNQILNDLSFRFKPKSKDEVFKEYEKKIKDKILELRNNFLKSYFYYKGIESKLFKHHNDEFVVFSDAYVENLLDAPELKDKEISFNNLSDYFPKNVIPIVFKYKKNNLYKINYSIRGIEKFIQTTINFLKEKLNNVKDYNIEDILKAIPMKSQFQAICDECDLDLEYYYKRFLENNSANKSLNKENVIYLFSKYLAKVLVQEDSPEWYHVKWNKILIKLGYSGVVDTKNSGNVHPLELTQGAFLDIRQLKIIDILNNNFYYSKVSNQTKELRNRLNELNSDLDTLTSDLRNIIYKIPSIKSQYINIYLITKILNDYSSAKAKSFFGEIWDYIPISNAIQEITSSFHVILNNLDEEKNDKSIIKLINNLLMELNSQKIVNKKKYILTNNVKNGALYFR